MSATPIRALIGEQPLRLGDARQAEVRPEALCLPPCARRAIARSRSGRSTAGWSCSWRTPPWPAARRGRGASAMKAWPCGYAGHPDLGERMADLGHRPEQRQPVRVVTGLLGVATDDEGARRRRRPRARRCRSGKVRPVADHPRRQMRNGAEAARLELLAQPTRGLDALGWRRGDRHVARRPAGTRLVERVLEREQLEDRSRRGPPRAPRPPRVARTGRRVSSGAIRPPSRASTPCAGR